MDNSRISWRKTKEDSSYHYVQKGVGSNPKSHSYRKPSSGWQSFSWEKKFCAAAGVPWSKVLETKKYIYMDQNQKVLEWNDCEAEQGFWNARLRFWAQMHGLQCDIELPDPDIYIDKIDWDFDNVDPQLILDLDKGQPETLNIDGGIVLGIPVVPEQYLLTPTGWGDVEEQQPKDCEKHQGINNKDRDSYVYVPQNRNNGYTKQLENNGYNNKWNYKNSRYKISRFDNNGYCGPSFVEEFGYKRGNFGIKHTLTKWRPVTR